MESYLARFGLAISDTANLSLGRPSALLSLRTAAPLWCPTSRAYVLRLAAEVFAP
jgi:hypothetical protein